MTQERWYIRFAVRADPAAVLAARNEIPLERELVIETDTLKQKLGDGVNRYNDLRYLPGGAGILTVSEPPTGAEGTDGAYAIWPNDGEPILYGPKVEGAWPAGVELKGTDGEDGVPAEMRVSDGWVEWRPVGAAGWTALFPLSAIKGEPGPPGGPTRVLAPTSGAITLDRATHNGAFLRHSSGTITLPETGGTGQFQTDDIVEVRREAGQVQFAAAAGVTLDFNTALYSAEIHALKDVVALKVLDTNLWAIIGPLADA